MNAKKLLVNDCAQGQGIKRSHTCVVYAAVIFISAFQLKRKVLSEMATFMIAPKQEYLIRPINFQGQKIKVALDAKITTIHVVPEKQKLGCRRLAAGNIKKLHQIVELSVDIPANYGRRKISRLAINFLDKLVLVIGASIERHVGSLRRSSVPVDIMANV